MSAYKFKEQDFDEVDGVFVYATPANSEGSITVYKLIDKLNVTYQVESILDCAIFDGILTLLSNEPFEGQAVITTGKILHNSGNNGDVKSINEDSEEQ